VPSPFIYLCPVIITVDVEKKLNVGPPPDGSWIKGNLRIPQKLPYRFPVARTGIKIVLHEN
jgi:hypothetical protein